MYSMADSYKNLDKYPSEESCKNLSSSTYYSIVDFYQILAKQLDESSMNVSTFTRDKFLQDSWKNLACFCPMHTFYDRLAIGVLGLMPFH